MPNKIKRTRIAENIFFSSVPGSKFKTNTISVKFIAKLDKETAARNNIALSILSSACSKYPTRIELSRKLTELYGSSINSSVSSVGDYQIMSISCNWIDDAFTLNNDLITENLIDILLCCIFSPVASGDKFNEELFSQLRKEIVEDIEAEINNKRSWAINRAVEIAYEGQPYAVNAMGTKESALSATSANTFEAYKNVLANSCIEVIFCGCGDSDKVSERFTKAFADFGRDTESPIFPTDYVKREEIRKVIEPMDVKQCKLVMVYKTDCEDKYAAMLMSYILGATPFSKLFANVREKLSLCYYCSSRYNKYKNYLRIDSGVNTENLEIAFKEINRQLDDIAKGNFTDDEMNNALLSILDTINGTGDTSHGLIGWHFHSFIGKSASSLEEDAEIFRKATREQIICAAKSFILDTVYTMQASENSEGNSK